MRLILFCLLLLGSTPSFSQSSAIGSWREHLPYRQGAFVEVGPDRVYCATSQGLFAYRKDDQSLQRYSKLNGLNDFGISHIYYSTDYKLLVIAYENANIDLLSDGGKVTNLSDIKRKNIPGNKRINRITGDGRYIYFACGFGIVVLDLQRNEIKDTYYIGDNGAAININEVALSSDHIFAATAEGVYMADRNNPSLSDFNNWSLILPADSDGSYNRAVVYNNVLLVNWHQSAGDSLLQWNNGWSVPAGLPQTGINNSLRVANNTFILTRSDKVESYDSNFILTQNIDNTVIPDILPADATGDNQQTAWIADQSSGLIMYNGSGYTRLFPAGPNSPAVAAMQVVDDRLWVIHGPKNRGWTNTYRYDGFSYYEGGGWTSFDGYYDNTSVILNNNFFDNMSIVTDPSNKEHVYIGSGGAGMIEFNNGNVTHFTKTNSTLKEQFGNPGQLKVHGMALDEDANLWVTNAGVNTVLNVRKPNGTWRAYNLPGVVNASAKTGDIVIDLNGAKWVVLFENTGLSDGILYYNDNRSPDDLSDDQFDLIPISSNRVRSLAVDFDGTIWAGMDAGLYLFYPPSLEPQKIIIKQEGSYQYLLETESVTSIVVDGANRKWVGTENAGVFLFSSDGQEQLLHYTAENSPLFSNNIYAITIDGKTGQVYIGTDKGLISYQGDAVSGEEKCTDVEVYPNPVSTGYAGPIAIKGVPQNGTVKITDVSGNLVYQTQALGGQAIWYGSNLKGERASTGVYLVFAMNQDGEETCTAKLLFNR